jgi:hypothetical protein
LDVISIFMLINDIMCVSMLLVCHLCFITTMFIKEGDQAKPMIPSHVLIIRKLSSYFYVVLLAVVKPKNHINIFYSLCFILVL